MSEAKEVSGKRKERKWDVDSDDDEGGKASKKKKKGKPSPTKVKKKKPPATLKAWVLKYLPTVDVESVSVKDILAAAAKDLGDDVKSKKKEVKALVKEWMNIQ